MPRDDLPIIMSKALQFSNEPSGPLRIAIANENLIAVSDILEQCNIGPDFRFSGKSQESLLHYIVIAQLYEFSAGKQAILEFLLLKFKANPNHKNNIGQTLLHDIVSFRRQYSLNILSLFLENGANPNIQDKDGMTPLHLRVKLIVNNRCTEDDKQCINELIKAGAVRTIKNNKGETAEDIEPSITEIIDEVSFPYFHR